MHSLFHALSYHSSITHNHTTLTIVSTATSYNSNFLGKLVIVERNFP